MILLIDVFKAVLMCIVFILILRAIQIKIQYKKTKYKNFGKTSQVKQKILMTSIACAGLVSIVYFFQCRNHQDGSIGLLECIYINPGKQLARDVAIALFINTTLFLGSLHQELYVIFVKFQNGRIRKKFMRFYKK